MSAEFLGVPGRWGGGIVSLPLLNLMSLFHFLHCCGHNESELLRIVGVDRLSRAVVGIVTPAIYFSEFDWNNAALGLHCS